jgi:hypothetical protein
LFGCIHLALPERPQEIIQWFSRVNIRFGHFTASGIP